jgi:thioredoxin 2
VRCAHCATVLPWVVDAGDADLAAALDTRQLVLIDLWAPWCAPCRMVAPVLERLAGRYAGRVKVVKVNVDENPATAARYDARSIPTLVLVRGGQPVGRVVGAQPEGALAREIERVLAET